MQNSISKREMKCQKKKKNVQLFMKKKIKNIKQDRLKYKSYLKIFENFMYIIRIYKDFPQMLKMQFSL